MRQPTLFLTVELPCTGKTTAARLMEVEQKALRLTKDEWVKALYGHENPPSAQDVIEGRLIQIGLRALELGNNVVIDYGLWGRDERSALRQAAADLGAMVEMRYFELTPAERRRRLGQRQTEAPHTTWPMSDEELAEWLPTSTSQRQVNSTAANPLTIHRLDSRHGTSGAGIAGRRRSPDACCSPSCHAG
jgi:predicted kinase